jgi:hypothetical protein
MKNVSHPKPLLRRTIRPGGRQEGPIFKGCVNLFPTFGRLEPFEG